MSAIAVHAAVGGPAPAAGAAPASADSPREAGFAALLGEMSRPKSAPKDSEAQAKPPKAPQAPDASTQTALQSLELALAGLANPPPAPSAGRDAPAKPPAPETLAAPSSRALQAVAGALDGGSWDASGKVPLKALLHSDPSLGLSEFQMKTFLSPAGATPARAGATPLAAAKIAEAAASATVAAPTPSPPVSPHPARAAARPGADASNSARASAPRIAGDRSTSAATPSPGAAVAAAGSAGAASGDDARRGGGDSASRSLAAAPLAATAASPAGGAGAPFVVPLASLPSFIADQASALATDGGALTPATAAAPAETPKAAQAVKELNIALEPADLGRMTLKLRLAGGKLSVTIAVANPRTLTSIEDDRALIAARLNAGDRTLEDLVIQRQTPSTNETASLHAFANDSGAEPSKADGDGDSSTFPDRGSGAPPRGRARGGGAFGDVLV